MGKLLIVHFSDIHLGSTMRGTHHDFRLFRPLSGHELAVCGQLQDALNPAKALSVQQDLGLGQDDQLRYVLSGDLTRVGSVDDFYLAYGWLLGHLVFRSPARAPQLHGLSLPPADFYAVPGNHDHWDGRTPGVFNLLSPPAYTPGLAPDWFQATPWRTSLVGPEGDFILELFGVDSNSGLAGLPGNAFAEGEISQAEFAALERKLEESQLGEQTDHVPRLRAIVCHHPFEGRGVTQGLRDYSADRLKEIAFDHGVAAVLSGHLHAGDAIEHRAPQRESVWEIRAASAVQYRPSALHGFWVHELTCEQGQPGWRAHRYEADANKGPFRRIAAAYTLR